MDFQNEELKFFINLGRNQKNRNAGAKKATRNIVSELF